MKNPSEYPIARTAMLALALATGKAEAKDLGMTPPFVAEHCDVAITPKQLNKLAADVALKVQDALVATTEENVAAEKENAMVYLEEIKAIPYSKMKSAFAKLQATTNLEDPASIAEANKQLKLLEEELLKADELLNKHIILNSGGGYDLAYLTPNPDDTVKSDLKEAFDEAREKGIDCDESVESFVLINKKFPGAGELMEELKDDAGATNNSSILPEVAAFDSEEEDGDLKTKKAKYMSQSEEFKKHLLKSEAKSLTGASLIKSKYSNSNK